MQASRFLPDSPASAILLCGSASSLPRPALIFLHSATTHQDAFLEEAKPLAEDGFICLLPELPYGRTEWQVPRGLRAPEKEAEIWELCLSELSRWTDLLVEEGADPRRILLVGRNLGGGVGGAWLRADRRAKAAIITGAIPNLSQFWAGSDHPVALKARAGLEQAELLRAATRLEAFDLTRTLPELRNRQLLLQFGTRDEWIDRHAADALENLIGYPKEVAWVDDDHDMNSALTVATRRRWLIEQAGAAIRS